MPYNTGTMRESQGKWVIFKVKRRKTFKKPAWLSCESQAACRCLPSIHGDGQLGHAAVEEIQRIPRVFEIRVSQMK